MSVATSLRETEIQMLSMFKTSIIGQEVDNEINETQKDLLRSATI